MMIPAGYNHVIDLDYETWSEYDIKSAGGFKYAEKGELLMVSFSIDEAPVQNIDVYHDGLPNWFIKILTDPKYLKRSHNAAFERLITWIVLGIYSPPEQWECLMVKSAMAGLPMSLDDVSKALGLSEKKDYTGKSHIRYFCIPCKATKANGFRTRNLPEHDMPRWKSFIQYCDQDVVTQQAIAKALSWFEIPATEKRLWCLDQKCNEKGISIDFTLINNAIEMYAIFHERMLKEAVKLTGLSNANSVAQLKKWIEEETGDAVKSLSKGAIASLIESVESDKAREVLKIRSLLSKSSIKKYQAMLNSAGKDGRIRGTLQFYGAGRTGRDAGRGLQIQNLARISMSEEMLAEARQLILDKDLDMVNMCFDNLPDVLSQLVRTAIVPSKGNNFFVSDYRSVEAVVLSWLAGEQKVLDLFNKHPKIYEATASIMFNIPIESIVKGSNVYQQGKVSNLAMGFQGGFNAVVSMMDSLGMTGNSRIPDANIPGMVKIFREKHPNIVRFWYDLDRAAKNTVKTGTTNYVGSFIKFVFKNKNLLMYLPSGRFLCYHGAHVKEVWNVQGKILGYADKPVKVGGFLFREPEILKIQGLSKDELEKRTWSDPSVKFDAYLEKGEVFKGYYEFNDKGEIVLTFLGKIKKTYFKIDETRTISYDDLNTLLNVQKRDLLLFWAINQTTKQWALSSTYGGKLAENATQATARDCLMNGVINLDEGGYDVVMRVHDETVSDNAEGDLDEVNALMTKPAPWMKGLPLKAAGFVGKYYQK